MSGAEATLCELLDAAQSLAACIRTEQQNLGTDHGDHIGHHVKRIGAVHRKWKDSQTVIWRASGLRIPAT